jgi:hypothetical protein
MAASVVAGVTIKMPNQEPEFIHICWKHNVCSATSAAPLPLHLHKTPPHTHCHVPLANTASTTRPPRAVHVDHLTNKTIERIPFFAPDYRYPWGGRMPADNGQKALREYT